MEYVEEGQEHEAQDPTLEMDAEPQAASVSLAARMRDRAEQLERQKTERFPLPGWEDVLEVELRVGGVRQATKIASRNQRVRDEGTRNLYVMCDLLLLATTGFWEVPVNGNGRAKPIDDTWTSLAQRLPNCPQDLSPRQAMLFLLKEHRVPWLYTDWETWQRSVRTEVDEELGQDFVPTG